MAGVRGALLLVVAALALGLGGCTIQMALDTTVEADGSGTVGVRLAADKEIQDLMAQQAGQQGDLFGEFEKQVPKDWRVEKGTETNGTKWVKASKAFKDPAELDAVLSGRQAEGGLGGALAGDTFSVKQSRGLFRVTTTFDATWDAGKAVTEAQKGLSDNVSLDMVARLPSGEPAYSARHDQRQQRYRGEGAHAGMAAFSERGHQAACPECRHPLGHGGGLRRGRSGADSHRGGRGRAPDRPPASAAVGAAAVGRPPRVC
jgi:hypothetical protein